MNARPGALPAQNIDAEIRVLGGILANNANIVTARQVLLPQDFYRPAHGIVFEAMRSLADQGQPIDYVTLRNELLRTGRLDRAGEYNALGDDASGADIRPYVRMVAECAQRRGAITRLEAGLEEWAKKTCEQFKCSYKISVSANYW